MSDAGEVQVEGYRLEQTLGERDGIRAWLARDLALDRLVVLKLLRSPPEDTDRGARLIQAARLLASGAHRNLVAVHAAGSAGGISFVDLEYLGTDSLAGRLGKPLSTREALRLSRELLATLDALHARGVVHGAIRPTNVFRVGRRYVLADSPLAAPATSDGRSADLRAAGAVICQALTGAAWDEPAGTADWSAIPRRFRSVLRRNWPDAASFRAALDRVGRRRVFWARAGAALAASAAVVGFWPDDPAPPQPALHLAVLPFSVASDSASGSLSLGVTQLLQLALDGIPGLALAGQRDVLSWWDKRGREVLGGDKSRIARELRARWVAIGRAERRGDSLRIRVVLHDSMGSSLPEIRFEGPESDLVTAGESLALGILRSVAPDAKLDPDASVVLQGGRLDALRAFLQGEAAFQREAWSEAGTHYREALGHDSTFALAEWRLANVLRWRREPYELALDSLYHRHLSRLRTLDRLLIEAFLEPDLGRRFGLLEAATDRYPDDAYAQLLYGEELFHRGPLVGLDAEESVGPMQRAIARDPLLGQAYEHVFFAHLREGRSDDAREVLEVRRRLAEASPPGDLDAAPLLELAYDERFVPWRAGLKRWWLGWTADGKDLADIDKVARLGNSWLDIPASQLALSRLLYRESPPASPRRASAHEGMALALYALGRPGAAFAHFDTAATLLHRDEARLQAAQWRLLPAVLGLAPRDAAADTGRARLSRMDFDAGLRPRAEWSLALDRYAAGDMAAAASRAGMVTGDAARPLRELLRAAAAAAGGEAATALAISDSVRLAFQQTRPPDGFAVAAFHVLRLEWALAAGDTALAGRESVWYQASEMEGWPKGLAQPGEVTGTLGVAARLRRARLLLQSDPSRACALLRRVRDLWSGAEAGMRPFLLSADSLARGCP